MTLLAQTATASPWNALAGIPLDPGSILVYLLALAFVVFLWRGRSPGGPRPSRRPGTDDADAGATR
jgi:hypothetical protein